MKKLYVIITAFVMTSQMIVITSCSSDDAETVSAIDPLPFPYSANKDISVHPGDSFFDYCNGKWLKENPIPTDTTKSLGGIYACDDAMQERVTQLKKSVPDLKNYFALMTNIHENPEASYAYISALKQKYPKPQSKEEAFRTIGRMYLEGLNVLHLTIDLRWVDDKLKFYMSTDKHEGLAHLTAEEKQSLRYAPLSNTRAGDGGENSIPALMAKAMGIDLSMIVTDDSEDDDWKEMWDSSTIDGLCQEMQSAWLEYEAYADEKGLEDYNKSRHKKEPVKTEDLAQNAKTVLGYTLSYHLQQKYITQSMKDKILAITKEIQAALRKRIQKVDWMSETTKQNAIDKLDYCRLNVAFPDVWHMDCIPALTDCRTMVEALHKQRTAYVRLLTKLVGTDDVFSYYLTKMSTDSNGEPMSMDLSVPNAFYVRQYNCVMIYPALFMSPMIPDDSASEACSYAVFSIIGHEFTHGFDSNGAQWDKYGKKNNWWTVADMMNFEDRVQALIRIYNNMELDPQREPLFFCDGNRTKTENIADLGGFLATLDAYTARLDQQGFTGETRNEQLRKFYESYAHVWCIQYGEKKFNILKNSDNHAHARLRINGVVMNSDLWYQLYSVDRNHRLYLPKERRAYIW